MVLLFISYTKIERQCRNVKLKEQDNHIRRWKYTVENMGQSLKLVNHFSSKDIWYKKNGDLREKNKISLCIYFLKLEKTFWQLVEFVAMQKGVDIYR